MQFIYAIIEYVKSKYVNENHLKQIPLFGLYTSLHMWIYGTSNGLVFF